MHGTTGMKNLNLDRIEKWCNNFQLGCTTWLNGHSKIDYK